MDYRAYLISKGFNPTDEEVQAFSDQAQGMSQAQLDSWTASILQQGTDLSGLLTDAGHQTPTIMAPDPSKSPSTPAPSPPTGSAAYQAQQADATDTVQAQIDSTQAAYEKSATAPIGGTTAAPEYDKSLDQFNFLTQDEQDYKNITGHDPKQAFQDYVNALGQTDMGPGAASKANYQQWVHQQAQLAVGPIYSAIRNLQQYYANQYGGQMPPELTASIEQYFKDNPDQVAIAQSWALEQAVSPYSVSATTGSTTGAGATTGATVNLTPAQQQGQANSQFPLAGANMLSSMPGLAKIITNYTSLHPSMDTLKTQRETFLRDQYQSATGVYPDQATLDTMFGMSDAQVNTYLDQQNVHGTNLTYGQYRNSQSLANSLWSTYFAGQAPTKDDINMIAGFKDSQQAKDWVLSLPSHIAGMNVGNYTGLHTEATNLSTKLWNIPAGPDIMNHIASTIPGK